MGSGGGGQRFARKGGGVKKLGMFLDMHGKTDFCWDTLTAVIVL